jgi:hypothetical protein
MLFGTGASWRFREEQKQIGKNQPVKVDFNQANLPALPGRRFEIAVAVDVDQRICVVTATNLEFLELRGHGWVSRWTD